MPRIVRTRIVVDGTPSDVAARVRARCHPGREYTPEDWAFRVVRGGFRVSTGATRHGWAPTVAVALLVEREPGRTEVSVQAGMRGIGTWFGRVWFVVCALGLAWSVVALSTATTIGGWGVLAVPYMLLMVAMMFGLSGHAVSEKWCASASSSGRRSRRRSCPSSTAPHTRVGGQESRMHAVGCRRGPP